MNLPLIRAVDRLRRLADTLLELKDRVREAVATEAGRAVGDAVRDLLTTILRGPVLTTPMPPTWRTPEPARHWSDDRDDYDDPFESEFHRPHWNREVEPTPSRTMPASSTWSTVVSVGAAAARCWATRTVPAWLAVGVAVAAGVTAVVGGPVACGGLAVLTAAVELLPFTT